MESFAVYGGCVTRDVFNYLNGDDYCPVLTIGQNPISTMFSPPFPFELSDFEIGHNFDKRMLYYDANKLALEKIKQCDASWFIFDMICERITIMEFSYENKVGLCEKSWDFVDNYLNLAKSEKWKGIKKIRDIDVCELGEEYLDNIDRFCDMIFSKFASDHIIFLECEMAKQYWGKDNNLYTFNVEPGYKLITKYNDPDYANEQIARATERIRKNMPNINYIPMPKDTIADEKHHFGLHPLHYSDSYYLYAARALKTIVNGKDEKGSRDRILNLCDITSEYNSFIKNRLSNNRKRRFD